MKRLSVGHWAVRSRAITVESELPDDLRDLRLPDAVQRRLQHLLDRQDAGEKLTEDERCEAEVLVDAAEFLSLLKLRAQRDDRQ